MSEPLLLPFRGIMPRIHPTAFIAPNATIIGDVEIGEGSSVWFGCVLRGDMNKIIIGKRTNIQDGAVVHVSTDKQVAVANGLYPSEGYPTVIGDDVLIGHKALLHACVIESRAFVGMGAIVLDGARVAGGSVLAAGSLLPQGKSTTCGEIWMGNPARFCRRLTAEELKEFPSRSGEYALLAQEYRKEH